MVTEILGFLIILGAILVLVVRQLSRRHHDTASDEIELRDATELLKAELQRSADAVIARMGSHITHLETLLQRAEERNNQLEASISQARQMQAKLRQQNDDLAISLAEAKRWTQVVTTVSAQPVTPSPAINVPTPPVEPEDVRLDAQNFAAVLKNSIERDSVPADNSLSQTTQSANLTVAVQEKNDLDLVTTENSIESSEAPILETDITDSTVNDDENSSDENDEANPLEPIEPEPAAKAKAMLRSGYAVEAVAKETGLGKGAILLLQKMTENE